MLGRFQQQFDIIKYLKSTYFQDSFLQNLSKEFTSDKYLKTDLQHKIKQFQLIYNTFDVLFIATLFEAVTGNDNSRCFKLTTYFSLADCFDLLNRLLSSIHFIDYFSIQQHSLVPEF